MATWNLFVKYFIPGAFSQNTFFGHFLDILSQDMSHISSNLFKKGIDDKTAHLSFH